MWNARRAQLHQHYGRYRELLAEAAEAARLRELRERQIARLICVARMLPFFNLGGEHFLARIIASYLAPGEWLQLGTAMDQQNDQQDNLQHALADGTCR